MLVGLGGEGFVREGSEGRTSEVCWSVFLIAICHIMMDSINAGQHASSWELMSKPAHHCVFHGGWRCNYWLNAALFKEMLISGVVKCIHGGDKNDDDLFIWN